MMMSYSYAAQWVPAVAVEPRNAKSNGRPAESNGWNAKSTTTKPNGKPIFWQFTIRPTKQLRPTRNAKQLLRSCATCPTCPSRGWNGGRKRTGYPTAPCNRASVRHNGSPRDPRGLRAAVSRSATSLSHAKFSQFATSTTAPSFIGPSASAHNDSAAWRCWQFLFGCATWATSSTIYYSSSTALTTSTIAGPAHCKQRGPPGCSTAHYG